MLNAKYRADIVITKHFDGHVIWAGDTVIANVDKFGLDLICAGASAMKLSVYDEEAGHFLTGTVDQLAPI